MIHIMAKNDENDLRFQNIALFHRGIFLRSFVVGFGRTPRRRIEIRTTWRKSLARGRTRRDSNKPGQDQEIETGPPLAMPAP